MIEAETPRANTGQAASAGGVAWLVRHPRRCFHPSEACIGPEVLIGRMDGWHLATAQRGWMPRGRHRPGYLIRVVSLLGQSLGADEDQLRERSCSSVLGRMKESSDG